VTLSARVPIVHFMTVSFHRRCFFEFLMHRLRIFPFPSNPLPQSLFLLREPFPAFSLLWEVAFFWGRRPISITTHPLCACCFPLQKSGALPSSIRFRTPRQISKGIVSYALSVSRFDVPKRWRFGLMFAPFVLLCLVRTPDPPCCKLLSSSCLVISLEDA